MKKKKSPAKKLLTAGLILLCLFVFWWFENYTVSVSTTVIRHDKISNEIKIVHLTDLHGISFGKENRRLIDKIDKEKPDLIFATGDMYTAHDDKGRKTAVKLMTGLAEKYPVYFVPGEHDGNDAYLEELRNGGIRVMDYEFEDIEIKGNRLTVYGIDNAYFSPTFDLRNEWEKVDAEHFNILLSHIPSRFKSFAGWGADLVLSGDTHGGYIRLPFIGPLIYQDPGNLFPKFTYDRHYTDIEGNVIEEEVYDKGLFEENGKYLYVSAGLGYYPVPCRLLNRPELAVIILKPIE